MKTLPTGKVLWESEDDEKLTNLYNRGLSLNAIAEVMDARYSQIEHRIRRLRKKGLISTRLVSKAAQDKLEDQKTQTEGVVELLLPHIKQLNYYDPKPLISKPTIGPEGDRSVEEAVLVLSDIHFGKKTESFNYRVLGERFEKLHYSVARIIGLLKKGYKIDKLNIFLIGDIVDGDMIYPGHAHGVEVPVIDQIYQMGFPMLRDFLLSMSKIFPQIDVHCEYGNHGRVHKDASRKTNFDYVLYKHLEAYFRKYPKIKFLVYDDWKAIVPVQGHNFLITHGDAISGGSNGVPLTGIIGALMRWAKSMQEEFTYMVTGHFHTPWVFRWTKNLTTIGNGTMVSGDDFAERVLKIESYPCQQFFGVSKRRGMTWHYTIDLSDTALPANAGPYRLKRGIKD